MEFSIKLHTLKSGWSAVYIQGSQVISFKKCCISFYEDRFCFANSADPDEMLHHHISSGAALFAKVPI